MNDKETITELNRIVDNLEWLVMKIRDTLERTDHADNVKLERLTKLLAAHDEHGELIGKWED